MKHNVGSTLNMVTAQPGWRVVLGLHGGGKVIQDILGWATIVTQINEEEDWMESEVEPVFVVEGSCVGRADRDNLYYSTNVLEILQPGEESRLGAQTWAEKLEEEAS